MTGFNFYGSFKKTPPTKNKIKRGFWVKLLSFRMNQPLTLRGSPVPVQQSSGVGFVLTYNGGFSCRERGNTNQAFRKRL